MLESLQRLSLTSTQYYTQISTGQFSERLLSIPPIKRIDSISITNFKSFKGKVYVGPLLDFTSIVGPNGVGKSNVLDALMFCFCNQKSKLTFFDLREFITRESNQTYKDMSKKDVYCEVEVIFMLQNQKYFSISRILYPDQRQLFTIDGEEYSQKVYENFLMRNNINYITSNFAIWQGEIDKLLLKSPKELTNFIETISGSIFFKKEQDDLKNQIKDIQTHMQGRNSKLLKLKQDKKLIKNYSHHKKQADQLHKQYEDVLKQIFLVKSYLFDQEIRQLQSQIKKKQKQEKNQAEQINKTKAELQKQQIKRSQLENKAQQYMKKISESYACYKNMEQLNNVIDMQTVSELEKQINSLKQYHDHLLIKKGQVQKQLNNQANSDISKQYLQLYTRWENENESITKQLKKSKQDYLYTDGILQAKRNIHQQFVQKQSASQDLKRRQLSEKKQVEKNIQQVNKNHEKLKFEMARLTQQAERNNKSIGKIHEHIMETTQRILDLETLMSESIENQKDKQILLKLIPIEGFKGLLSDYIRPSNKKYQVCFQMLTGIIQKYLLCISQGSSKQITIKLRQNYQIRNLVILNNVREKKQVISRATLGKNGTLAIDSIDFDKNVPHLEIYLKEYLNGKIICQDLSAAWNLLGQHIKGIRQIYTLDGNVLRQDGVVSNNGSVEFRNKKYKYIDIYRNNTAIMNDIQNLIKQKTKLEGELSNIKKNNNDLAMIKLTMQMKRLQTKKQQLGMKLNYLTNSIESKKNINMPQGLEKQIQELEKRAKALYSGVQQIQKQMLKSKIFSNFLDRNKIDRISQFRSVLDLSSLEINIKKKSKILKEQQDYDRQITKVDSQLNQKQEKLKRLNEKINSVRGIKSKQQIKIDIKRDQDQLTAIRNQLSKMKHINLQYLKFKSYIPQMISKLQILKQRKDKQLKQEAQNLGLTEIPKLDYHILEERVGIHLQRANRQRIQLVQKQLDKQKNDLEAELQKNDVQFTGIRSSNLNPKQIDEQILRISEQLKQANSRKNELEKKIQKIKQNRKALFMNFMNELKPILQLAYQILTKRQNGSGRVEMYMENEIFPCDQGLYYTPIPPTKRFVYDLNQLSGGQKSIASLALQYAIAIVSKSPFLVLDETDAFLDAQNLRRFVSLIRKNIQKSKIQFIVITHKRNLFMEGESLVGLTKFKDDPFTKAFSLRLDDIYHDNE